jgi:hypothetical protein
VLALVLTLILALYILGPDLFSRLVVSQFVPARPRIANKSEEVARAILLSSIPVTCVWVIAHFMFGRFSNASVLKDFLSGLYGEASLAQTSDKFFAAAIKIIQLNVEVLLAPVYGFVFIVSVGLGILIRSYGRVLRANQNRPKVAAVVTWLVRPWVAEWHLKLSGVLLPRKTDYIQVDVLTKLDVLFRGTLAEHHLAPDGTLISIVLLNPKKFKRKEFLDARRLARARSVPDPANFWSLIEARSFIIMASEIVTLNLNYVDPESLAKKPTKVSQSIANRALDEVRKTRQKSHLTDQ